MKREVDSHRVDSRWRADLHLVTGVVVTEVSEWKPSHWGDQEFMRQSVLDLAKKQQRFLLSKYGLESTEIVMYQETRGVTRVIETTYSERVFSHHPRTMEGG